jgi:hypothetical protein
MKTESKQPKAVKIKKTTGKCDRSLTRKGRNFEGTSQSGTSNTNVQATGNGALHSYFINNFGFQKISPNHQY